MDDVNDTTAADSEELLDTDALAPEPEAPTEDSETTKLARERDEFKDIALRLQADFENFRKRSATLITDEVDRATGRLVEAMLPVLDACEAAVAHGVSGVEQVWSALLGALQREGLEALDLEGTVFDPALAEAVLREEGDGPEPVVAEVLRTGYRWKGRVLRAAMVKVKG